MYKLTKIIPSSCKVQSFPTRNYSHWCGITAVATQLAITANLVKCISSFKIYQRLQKCSNNFVTGRQLTPIRLAETLTLTASAAPFSISCFSKLKIVTQFIALFNYCRFMYVLLPCTAVKPIKLPFHLKKKQTVWSTSSSSSYFNFPTKRSNPFLPCMSRE